MSGMTFLLLNVSSSKEAMGKKINYDYEVVSDISHRRRLIKTGWRVRGRRTNVRLHKALHEERVNACGAFIMHQALSQVPSHTT